MALKSAQFVAPRKIEIVDLPEPDFSEAPPESVLVQVERTGICASDMPPFYQNRPPEAYPFGLGLSLHECVGTVVASNCPRFREGDRVLSFPQGVGGLVERFRSSSAATIPLPEFQPLEHLLMAQPLGTVIWAMRKLPPLLGKEVVVLGQGPMGLLLTHVLSNLGARTIVALDKLDYRLEVARRMRATHTCNVTRDDPVEAVREITGGRMADLVVEAVGQQTETLNQCLDLVRDRGTILGFGITVENLYPFRYGEFFRRNLTLIGSVGPEVQHDYPLAVDWILQGRVQVAPLITHILPFTEVQRGFELAWEKKDGAIKVILDHTVSGSP
jgi:threonine dehydrogenase-like Zn-dependent dehydrogenase